MKQALAYIRVSSEDQLNGNSIDRQIANVEAYCQRADLQLVGTITDEGKSAFKGHHLSGGEPWKVFRRRRYREVSRLCIGH